MQFYVRENFWQKILQRFEDQSYNLNKSNSLLFLSLKMILFELVGNFITKSINKIIVNSSRSQKDQNKEE